MSEELKKENKRLRAIVAEFGNLDPESPVLLAPDSLNKKLQEKLDLAELIVEAVREAHPGIVDFNDRFKIIDLIKDLQTT